MEARARSARASRRAGGIGTMAAPALRGGGALGLALACVSPALAMHPMISEDPGTQGEGRYELELGYQSTRGDPSDGRTSSFSPQLSWGALPALDVIVQPAWLTQHPVGGGAVRGWGDTAVDVKWRFHESGEVAVAVRAGLSLPTGSAAKGLGASGTGAHAVIAGSLAAGEGTLLGNLGVAYARFPGDRSTLPYATAAYVAPVGPAWQTFVEVATQRNSDPARSTWPAVARTGLVWTVAEGVDLDVGAEGRLNRAAPSFTALAGVTVHW